MKKLDGAGKPSFGVVRDTQFFLGGGGLYNELTHSWQHMFKKEYDAMVWEVDENLDGAIDWSEFQLLYVRKHMDKTGLEPWKMFTIVQVSDRAY
jgi:hypothetical protein